MVNLENPKIMMVIASLMGALAGIYYTTAVNPLNSYILFMALFAMAGIAAGNLVLLIIVEVYGWLRSAVKTRKEPKASLRTSALK